VAAQPPLRKEKEEEDVAAQPSQRKEKEEDEQLDYIAHRVVARINTSHIRRGARSWDLTPGLLMQAIAS